jgi:hypothetical protein
VDFAVAFTRRMRRQKQLRYVPSLRTSLAIPRLLAARWMRLRALTAKDYEAAAVLCTPYEDQPVAEAVARSLLFPDTADEPDAPVVDAAPEAVAAEPDAIDPFADLLSDLSDLGMDLDALDDFGDVVDALDDDDDSAFELFERLYNSVDPAERALGELIHAFGGPGALEAEAVRTLPMAQVWVVRALLGRVGDLAARWLTWGVAAGFAPELRRACEVPWEVAGVLAAEDAPELEALLDDLLDAGDSAAIGRTLTYLEPSGHPSREAFVARALAQALDLADHAAMVVGYGEWIAPDDAILDASVASNPRRALEACRWLADRFGVDLRADVFERWLARQGAPPDLGVLSVICAPCQPWKRALQVGLQLEEDRLDDADEVVEGEPLPGAFQETVDIADALRRTQLDAGGVMARRLCTSSMIRVPIASGFLPLLDAFVGRRIVPHDVSAVLGAARALGVPDDEVLDRIGGASEQLRSLIEAGSDEVGRYNRLLDRIDDFPEDWADQLCEGAASHPNQEPLAALLAVALGLCAERLPEERITDALGYRGIGGGMNLVKQWYGSRERLPASLRAHVKDLARQTLLDEAFHWMGRGGSGQEGLVPQSRARPFRAGDGLDALDIEETLDAILCSAKPLDQLTEDDLFASERSQGKAAIAILLDISGSMMPTELASCGVAIVMVLGKLLPEEVALAAFESDTHVIKTFDEGVDLDTVADQVLELRAEGGTRVGVALQWAGDQLTSVSEADTRVLYLLSDFWFFEDEDVLRTLVTPLADAGARLLAASHSGESKATIARMLAMMPGEHLRIPRIDQLPALLMAAIRNLQR